MAQLCRLATIDVDAVSLSVRGCRTPLSAVDQLCAVLPAVRLSACDERRLRDAFEAEWSKFERRAEGAALAVDDMPWPDSRISIAGVEPSDSLAASKARVNASLLRWHPDKFESSHAAKFSADAAE